MRRFALSLSCLLFFNVGFCGISFAFKGTESISPIEVAASKYLSQRPSTKEAARFELDFAFDASLDKIQLAFNPREIDKFSEHIFELCGLDFIFIYFNRGPPLQRFV